MKKTNEGWRNSAAGDMKSLLTRISTTPFSSHASYHIRRSVTDSVNASPRRGSFFPEGMYFSRVSWTRAPYRPCLLTRGGWPLSTEENRAPILNCCTAHRRFTCISQREQALTDIARKLWSPAHELACGKSSCFSALAAGDTRGVGETASLLASAGADAVTWAAGDTCHAQARLEKPSPHDSNSWTVLSDIDYDAAPFTNEIPLQTAKHVLGQSPESHLNKLHLFILGETFLCLPDTTLVKPIKRRPLLDVANDKRDSSS